jgi:signal peptidase I
MKKHRREFKTKAEGSFFVAYTGPSMSPILQEPEILEIMPFGNRPLQAGDVVFFRSPGAHQMVVHRIVRLTPKGIFTRGDNNRGNDAFVLQPGDIQGRVVAAWQGQKKRAIAGGRLGWLIGRWLPWKRFLDRGLSDLLHSFYHALARRELLVALLPKGLRPRIVVFQNKGTNRPCLLLGRHIIGRYDDRRQQWQINRPFRLIVNEKELPTATLEE